jgi:hypothetical protein
MKHPADSHVRSLQSSGEWDPANLDRLGEQIEIEVEAREIFVDIAARDFGPPLVRRQNAQLGGYAGDRTLDLKFWVIR